MSVLSEKSIIYFDGNGERREQFFQRYADGFAKLYLASSPAEVSKLLDNHAVDLLVIDLELGKHSENEVPFLSQIDRQVALPMLAICDYTETWRVRSAMASGISEYLIRPLADNEFERFVQRLIGTDVSPPMYQSLNAEGNILDVNQAWLDEMRYEHSEVIGTFFGDYVLPECLEVVQQSYPRLKEYGFVNNVLLKLKRKDGIVFEAALNGHSIYNGQGDFIRTRCELRDLDYFLFGKMKLEKLLQKERELKELLVIKSTMQQVLINADDLAGYSLRFCAELCRYSCISQVSILLYDRKKGLSVLADVSRIDNDMATFLSEYELQSDDHPAVAFPGFGALLTSRPYFFHLPEKCGDLAITQRFLELGVSTAIGIPIPYRDGKQDGAMAVSILMEKNDHFSIEELDALCNMTKLLGFGFGYIELQRKKVELLAELNTQATTDPLTGTVNRRYFNEVLIQEMERSERYHEKLGLIMFDIDQFKFFNDEFGHAFGDIVLKRLCTRITAKLRSSDVLSRWGGEEFIIIVPNSSMSICVKLAEKLRRLAESTVYNNDARLTISLGVTLYREGESVSRLLQRVDQALYGAKHQGRNCVIYLPQERG